MTPDSIHAIALITMPLLTALVVLWARRFPNQNYSLLQRLLLSVLIGFFAHIVMTINFVYKCDNTGMNPGWQGVIPPLCMMLIVIFVPRKAIVALSTVILLVAGYKLCSQYDHLVNKSQAYTFIDQHTGVPALQGCSGNRGMTNSHAILLWHTSLTGICKVVN